MEKTHLFIAKSNSSTSNSQANFSSTSLSAVATATPARFRRSLASHFSGNHLPRRIFEASVAAAFVGSHCQRFGPDARLIIFSKLARSEPERRLPRDDAATRPSRQDSAAAHLGGSFQWRRRLRKIRSDALPL
jgi:hypothetical protein